MEARRPVALGFGIAIAAVSTLLAVGGAELVLRALRPEQRFYPYHASSVEIFYPTPEVTPGVEGISYFTTNSLGTRGPELEAQRVRLLTMGGSTTACTVLDDAETWPFLLMQYVNDAAKDPTLLWVTNSGKDGANSQHHLMHAKYLLPALPRLDFVLVYAGMNDVGMWLYQKEFDPNYLDDAEHWNGRVGEAFRVSNFTPEDWPWYKDLELWKRASIVKDRVVSMRRAAEKRNGAIEQDAHLEWLKEAQEKRQEREKTFAHLAKRESLPLAIEAYAENLRRIVALVRERGAEPILVPQFVETSAPGAEENPRFWMGAIDGGEQYLKDREFTAFTAQWNARMREVAEETGVLFVDVSRALSGKPDLFYDAVHFNERGAQEFARALASQLGPAIRARDERCRAGHCPAGAGL